MFRLPPSRLASLASFSGTSILLEITLTRLFATIFYPPSVFAVLSLAVLGLGLGAATATWNASLRREAHLPLYMSLAGMGTLVATGTAIAAAPFSIPAVLFAVAALPFFFIGLVFATVFSSSPGLSTHLYAADLVGAGLGVLLAMPIINTLGVVNSLMLASICFGASVFIGKYSTFRPVPSVLVAAGAIMLASNGALNWLYLDAARLPNDKPAVDSLQGDGNVIQTSWDAFARTDLIQPADGGPYQVYVDGAAGSIMPPEVGSERLLNNIGFLPFQVAQPESIFIIGPGGGLDVWFGLQSGVDEIVAVEVNPASVALVEAFGDYNGHLYAEPSVRVVVGEGRNVLRREQSSYDLIYLSQVITLSAERSGYTLAENTIYTVEAFEDYLQHLRPGGQIALTMYDEATMTRALAIAVAALNRKGLSDSEALSHTAAFLDPTTTPPSPVLIVRDQPFTREEAISYGVVAQDSGFAVLLLPPIVAAPPLDSILRSSVTFSQIIEQSEFDIAPSTDDRPFFFQFERGIPRNLMPLVGLAAGIAGIGGLLLLLAQRSIKQQMLKWAPLYFASLGVGFMVVETVIIQQTRLFLGHPSVAVTTVLAVLFVGGGLGSLIASRRLRSAESRIPGWPAAGVTALIAVWMAIWPQVSSSFLAADQPVRVVVTALSLLPLAILMGMPFPIGLHVVGKKGDRHIALAWAVNGAATVVGSVGAVTMAILAGFSYVLLASLFVYGAAAVLAYVVLGRNSG